MTGGGKGKNIQKKEEILLLFELGRSLARRETGERWVKGTWGTRLGRKEGKADRTLLN